MCIGLSLYVLFPHIFGNPLPISSGHWGLAVTEFHHDITEKIARHLFASFRLPPSGPQVGPVVQGLCLRSGSLSQDLCVETFASGSCRTSCARFLYECLLSKVFVSRSSPQNPAGPLVQNLCRRLPCAYLCARIFALGSALCKTSVFVDFLCEISLSICVHQDPVGPSVQDLHMRISCLWQFMVSSQRIFAAKSCIRTSCARFLRIFCARSLFQDLV